MARRKKARRKSRRKKIKTNFIENEIVHHLNRTQG
jgi:hypothetical protein